MIDYWNYLKEENDDDDDENDDEKIIITTIVAVTRIEKALLLISETSNDSNDLKVNLSLLSNLNVAFF